MSRGVAFGVVALLAAPACEPEPNDDDGQGGVAAGHGPTGPVTTDSTIPIDVTTGPAGPNPLPPCPPEDAPLPEEVPEGWERRTDWSCRCPFYVPNSPAYHPDPIEWIACPEDPYNGCERMAITWTSPDHDWPFSPIMTYLDNSNPLNPVLFTRRATYTQSPEGEWLSRHAWDVAAEVDGVVRSAVLQTFADKKIYENPGCLFDIVPPNEGHYFYDMVGNDVLGVHQDPSKLHGFLMGSYGDHAPTVVYKGAQSYGWRGGAKRLVRKHGNAIVSRADAELSDSQLMSERPTINVSVVGDSVFYLDGELTQDLWMWHPETGERNLIDLGNAGTSSLFDLAADAENLVWALGEDYDPSNLSDPYRKKTLWAAPVPGPRDALEPRLLGNAPHGLSLEPLALGCGYVAHIMPGITTRLAYVVRLSDGAAWKLPHYERYKPARVIGVTCEHLYLYVDFKPTIVLPAAILRVPLSSLEPTIL